MKAFIITVDTEGDNLWKHKKGTPIEVNNAYYLPRFHTLCERYGFKPVYLTNYEMANCSVFIEKAKEWIARGTCEIGVHLHAWNNPPLFPLKGPYKGNPYLIEYPEDIMRDKFREIYNLIVEKIGIRPVSHRAGRWAMDERYFRILEEFSITVDCSYTPGINWNKAKGINRGGIDYSQVPHNAHYIGNVLEVPVTIRKFRNCLNGSFKHRLKSMIKGEYVWMRPALSSVAGMKKTIEIAEKDGVDYIEFMIHSSEVMPNGSPYFQTEKDIDNAFKDMDKLFKYMKERGFIGYTLKEYYNTFIQKHENS